MLSGWLSENMLYVWNSARHQHKSKQRNSSSQSGHRHNCSPHISIAATWLSVGSCPFLNRGRDSSVGVATRYGMGGPGLNPGGGGGEIFPTRPYRPWGPPNLLYNGYRISFPGVKRPGRGVDHSPLTRAEVKERVQLYLYSPSGPSWPVLG